MNEPISAMKANRLYWLGRYEERVYLTLHLLRKCYDKMIDGEPEDYEGFWSRLDASSNYSTPEEFSLGMLYDEKNPCSIMSELNCAKDNAILLREDITTESLSYIEMSVAHMKKCCANGESNITHMQPVTDWALAFWGSITERMHNRRLVPLLMIGRAVEFIDMMLRYDYPYKRVADAYAELKRLGANERNIFDSIIEKQLDGLLTDYQYEHADIDYKYKLLKYINHLVLV